MIRAATHSGEEVQNAVLSYGSMTAPEGLVALATPLPTNAAMRGDVHHLGATQAVPVILPFFITTATDNTVVAAVAGKKIRILSLSLFTAVGDTLTFKSGATNLFGTGTWVVPANGQLNWAFNPYGVLETTSGAAFVIAQVTGNDVLGTLTYVPA